MKKVLITGYNGFVGGYLAHEILMKYPGALVIGVDKSVDAGRNRDVVLEECNLADFANVFEVVKKYSPEVIFHLAAESSVASSWHSPSFMISNNVNAQINLLESLLKLNMAAVRVVVACSSEEYGEVDPGMLPVNEHCQFRPLSAYAVSKVAQDMMAFQYFKSYGMNIVRVRCFNLCGPGQHSKYVLSSFARQIAEIEATGAAAGTIKAGNLDVVRDYTDVRDAVGYYIELAEKGEAGEVYNLCSGNKFNLKDLLNILIGYSKAAVEVEVDPLKLRPSDLKVIYGDNSRLLSICGYSPRFEISLTLRNMLDYWRDFLRRS